MQTNSIEGNYLNVNYLFKNKNKVKVKNGKVKNSGNILNTNLISKEVGHKFEKNIKTKKKEKYKNTFNNILKDIEELEQKLNTKSSIILKNIEKRKWNEHDNIDSNENINLTLDELESNENNNICKSGETNYCEIEKNKKDKKNIYFNLKKKKKKMFFNLSYRNNKVINILKYVSMINLQKYLGNKIYSFFIHVNYLFIMLDNGIIYYNKNYDEQNGGLNNISNFYYLTNIYLHKITNIKINNDGNIFSLDKAHILKYYSLKKSDLNIFITNKKIIFFDIFHILQKYNCLFISLTNGSFYFINMDTKKILLYDKVENILKKKNGWNQSCLFRKNIEWAYFNKINEHVLNGYLKVKNIFYFFYLIYSESHEKFFIYIIHKLNIYKILMNIMIKKKNIKKRKTNYTHDFTILNSSVYKNGESDYICFAISEKSDNQFYIVFVRLIGERNIFEKKTKKKMNKDKEIKYYNNTIIYFLDIQNINIVFSKVIGNYLVIVDKFLNITFYLLTKSYFQNMPTHNAPSLLGRDKKEINKNKNKRNMKYLTTHYKSYEDKVENFFLTRISKKKVKSNNIEHVETEKIDQNDECDKFTETQTKLIELVQINLGKESFRIKIQENFKIKFINEQMNEEEKEICSIYIITDTNILIKFAFNCMLETLEKIKNINIKTYPYLDNLNFFYSYNGQNKMCNFLLNGGKYFHLEKEKKKNCGSENSGSEHVSILEKNGNTFNESNINNIEKCNSKHNDNAMTQTNNIVNLQFYKKIALEKKNYFYKNLNVVFFKICHTGLRDRKQKRKKHNKFIDVIDVKNETKYKPFDFFFDDETIIFTFTNENNYNMSLYNCLKNCKDKEYLDNLNKQEKEMKNKINELRARLKNLIKENKKNYNDMKLNREAFFFDKKYINEIEIVKSEYEQIKNYFEIEKKEKENIINKLKKKCNVFDKINFIHGFRKGLFVTNLYKTNEVIEMEEINKSPNNNNNIIYNIGIYSKFINKIKTLRFIQIKETYYMQNVEKNNNLYCLKNTKNYIDEYLENLSSLFFVHYYSYKNINLNFLYSNLFNSTYKDNESQVLHWNYLLYYPYELFTNSRKRIQCFILYILIEQVK